MGNVWEDGSVGVWEDGSVGGSEDGSVGGWEDGRMGGWEDGSVGLMLGDPSHFTALLRRGRGGCEAGERISSANGLL